jgi:hypothetical protein
VDIDDVLVIETTEGEEYEFSVVGVVEDEEHNRYAICYSEAVDDFVVTDSDGKLLEDDDLAQEILDEFLELADDGSEEGEATAAEPVADKAEGGEKPGEGQAK